ncbi:MAG: radical SAM protein [Desulfobacteraceae bacterium]|nr:radical SAM protein [Desulfobacteraceae bacterium]
MHVSEIFYSIQGESSYAGRPCAFVRLTGCNLRCSYCDTRYAYTEGVEMAIPEIVGRIQEFGCKLVEITGGEPLLQEATPELVAWVLDLGYTVLIETNGSQDISRIDSRVIKIVDFKCPTSGESAANDLANIDRLNPHDEVKCVIQTREDFLFAKEIVRKIQQDPSRENIIHFSPSFGVLAPKMLAEWILADRLPVRLGLQLHKFVWDPNRRGV